MLNRIRTLKNNQEGATAIEFAIVAPVLFLMIFGIIEFGIMFTTQSALEGAASHAARTYKATARDNNKGATTGQIRKLVMKYSGGFIKSGKLRVVAKKLNKGWGNASMPNNAKNSSGRSGKTAEVIQYRIYYDYKVNTPFLSQILAGKNGKIILQASTVVQNEPSIGGKNGA